MKLSVLVCSTHTRYNTFLPRILDLLFGQVKRLEPELQKEVEVLTLIDNKTIVLGTKRNNLVKMASGDYVVFVDDDDRVSDNYIEKLLDATSRGVDAVTFPVMVSLDGGPARPCYYSKDYEKNFNTGESYHRLPNHIMAVKRKLALKVPFKPIVFGEDADYAIRLKPLLKTQYQVEEPLYFYDFNPATSETREPAAVPPKCDVVILSNAKNEQLEKLTLQAIESLLNSQQRGIFNIIVVEQAPGVEYAGATTLHPPGEFNYNRFANEAIRTGKAPWVCVSNNDVVFQRKWLAEMMKVKADVMSPLNPGWRRQNNITSPEAGYVNGRHFSGWCFVMKREVWKKIGGLDEDFPFWCADDSVIQQLKKAGIRPVLVPASRVNHLASRTLKSLDEQLQNELTVQQVKKFNRKYNQNLFNLGK